jgi:hypothetical protein
MSEELRYEHAERVRDFYRKQGAEREQQRIIELLLQHEVCGVDTKTNLMLNEDALIALIKGEN